MKAPTLRQACLGFFLFALLFAALPGALYAQDALPARLPDETQEQYEARLRIALDAINAEIAAGQQQLQSKQAESASISRDLSILDIKIKQAKLSIQQSELVLKGLAKDIGQKNDTITTLSGKIERNKESVANLLRRADEIDNASLTEFILLDKQFSEFFSDLDTYDLLKESLHASFTAISKDKLDTETAKKTLEDKQSREADAKAKIEKSKKDVETNEAAKKKLLAASKSQEKDYQALIADRQKKAASIRAALFNLRDTAAIPFGTAYEYAKLAEKSTGVRPAFLLAILTQETNLGKNVGTCNRPQDPPSKSWRVIMKPDRDQGPYQDITSRLGISPDGQPLSCPQGTGWGGAMGPAQFIPSTWVLYEKRIAAATGDSVPSPWNPKDAFAASSVYLSDLGAGNRTYTAERTAALKYYAGSAWQKSANAFYGNQVMAKADMIQANIDILEGN